jgi:hypothetical protein
MGFSLIASAHKADSINTITTSAIDTSGANLIIIGVTGNSGTLSDSKGNTWTPLTAVSGANTKAQIFYALNPTVGSGHTFSHSGSSLYSSVFAAAYSGAASSSVFVGESGANNDLGFITELQPGSVAPGGDGRLFFTVLSHASDLAVSVDSGFTELADSPLATVGGNAYAHKIQATGASENPKWTMGEGERLTAVMAVFAPSAAPTVSTTSLPSGVVGDAYSQTLAVTGGTGSITWSIVSGALPAGLSLNASTGAITGTPTTAGASSFTVRATDSAAAYDEQALSITINPGGAVSLGDFQIDGDESTLITHTSSGVWSTDVGALYSDAGLSVPYDGVSSVSSIYFVPFNQTAEGVIQFNGGEAEANVSVMGKLPDTPNYPLEWTGDVPGVAVSVARSGRRRGRIVTDVEYIRNYKLIYSGRTPAEIQELEDFFAYHYPDKTFKFENLWYDVEGYFSFDSKINAKALSRARGEGELAIAEVPYDTV